ncbi:MAG: hypothetical protein ACLQVX_22355 [Limisphaerales bacterium]
MPEGLDDRSLDAAHPARPDGKRIDPGHGSPSAPGGEQLGQGAVGQDDCLTDESSATMPDPAGPFRRRRLLPLGPKLPEGRTRHADFGLLPGGINKAHVSASHITNPGFNEVDHFHALHTEPRDEFGFPSRPPGTRPDG